MRPCTHSQTCYRCNEEALHNAVREGRVRKQHAAGIDYYFFPSWTQGSTTLNVEEARGQQGKKLKSHAEFVDIKRAIQAASYACVVM